MSRPLCNQPEDDGSPCTSWAIAGYDTCVAHWMPGDGPKRLHQPAYTGPYQEGRFKLDRPVQDEPAAPNARPYPAEPAIVTNPRFAGAEVAEGETPIAELIDQAIDRHRAAELTEQAETVETPVDNESLVASTPPPLTERELCEMPADELAALRAVSEARAELGLSPAEPAAPVLVPNPPSRRGWFKIFRRIA